MKEIHGNIVDIVRTIPLNQENDKPVVTVSEPVEGQNFGDTDPLFVRGIATDPDGVKEVRIQLDNNEPVVQETKGVFYYHLCTAEDLSAGNHKVTVTPIDVNDIANYGLLPQDLDIIVYERNSDDINSITNSSVGLVGRFSTNNPFEKVSFTSNAKYLLFRIKIYRDDERSENHGQLVLGFDLASGD